MKSRTKFYLGLIILLAAFIYLAILIVQGPHTRIPETTIEIIHDHPNGPTLSDMSAGDKLELHFESDKPVNVLLMETKNSGRYFNLEERTGFEYFVLASAKTDGSIKHTFNTSGDWKVYFESTNPPSPNSANPQVRYWGKIIREGDDMIFYYLNIMVCIILIILALLLLNSSRARKSGKKI